MVVIANALGWCAAGAAATAIENDPPRQSGGPAIARKMLQKKCMTDDYDYEEDYC